MEKINHTQISNDFIDNHISQLSGAEVKIFIAISRKTIGWHKDTDKISISQLTKLTGLSNRQIINSINILSNKKLITAIKSKGKSTVFEINYAHIKGLPVKKVHRCSEESSRVIVKTSEESSHTKEISIKDTKQKKIAPINGALFKEILDFFFLNNKELNMSRKEGSHINNIIKTGKDGKSIFEMLNKFLQIKEKDKSDWWQNAPFIPSVVYSRWNHIAEYKIIKSRPPVDQEENLRIVEEIRRRKQNAV